MPLLVDNKPYSDYESIKSLASVKEINQNFFKQSESLVKLLDLKKCLHVGQSEYASVRFNDESIDFIGSDDATTCHIVLIVDEENGNCALCHFDGSKTSEGIESMIQSLKRLSQSAAAGYSLYIAGGFVDSKKYSIKLTRELVACFAGQVEKFNLKLFCVTELNNIKKGQIDFPIIYGLCYNIKTKQIFKCNNFDYKGPDLEVRSARHYSSHENMSIFDPINSTLVIGPFDYESFDTRYILRRNDAFILDNCSTSPEQEPEDFVRNVRRTFTMMLQHPYPLETYFRNGKPNIYRRVENVLEWVRVEDDDAQNPSNK